MPQLEPRPYAVQFEPEAWDEITALPQNVQEQIFVVIEGLETEPRPGNS